MNTEKKNSQELDSKESSDADVNAVSKQKRVVYIGKSQRYWDDIQKKFIDLYPDKEFQFINLFEQKKENVKVLLHKVALLKIKCLYIDFSIYPDEMLQLALSIKRDVTTSHIIIVGLLDSYSQRDTLVRCIALGIYLNFTKTIGLTPVVHDTFSLAYPEEARDISFTSARIKFTTKATTFFKVGHISKNRLHLESDFELQDKEEINLNYEVTPELRCERFKVEAHGDECLFSVHKYWYELSFCFDFDSKIALLTERLNQFMAKKNGNKDIKMTVEQSKIIEGEISLIQSEIEVIKTKAQKDAQKKIPLLAEWVTKSKEFSRPKRTTVLVVDYFMRLLYQTHESFDGQVFSIRHQAKIDDQGDVLKKTYAAIICYCFVYPDEGEENKEKEEYKNIENLKKIINSIAKMKNYFPFIVIFNNKENKEDLLKHISYKQMIFYDKDISIETMKALVTIYEQKMKAKKQKEEAENDPKIYISKYDLKSLAYYPMNIEVLQISEIDLIFQAKIGIPLYTSFYVKNPIKMTITVVPQRQTAREKLKPGQYYAFISGLGELEKNNLRMFINKLVFTDIEEKKRREAQEYFNLNEKARTQKEAPPSTAASSTTSPTKDSPKDAKSGK